MTDSLTYSKHLLWIRELEPFQTSIYFPFPLPQKPKILFMHFSLGRTIMQQFHSQKQLKGGFLQHSNLYTRSDSCFIILITPENIIWPNKKQFEYLKKTTDQNWFHINTCFQINKKKVVWGPTQKNHYLY